MVSLPRRVWKPGSNKPNEYHLCAFDPGGGVGWAHLVLDAEAFSRPENKALMFLKSWDSGTFSGTQDEQVQAACDLIWRAHFGKEYNSRVDVVSEDFDLVQLIGGKELLSPVRINAILDWECRKHGLHVQLQNRSIRMRQTKERIQQFGFSGRRFGKDEFAAMQHAVLKLRTVKARSKMFPWKLHDPQLGYYWDCACTDGGHCDLHHT
jgi:hypothetical protein